MNHSKQPTQRKGMSAEELKAVGMIDCPRCDGYHTPGWPCSAPSPAGTGAAEPDAKSPCYCHETSTRNCPAHQSDVLLEADEGNKGLTEQMTSSPPPATTERLVIDLARELYDRFVMGGWEPQDAHPLIREMLQRWANG